MNPAFDSYDFVTPYGVTLVIALGVAWIFARRNARHYGIDSSHIDLVLPLSVLLGIGGAILLSADSAIRLIIVIGCGTMAVLAYSFLSSVSFLRLVDTLALPTLTIIVIQRVGCLLAGCCWGDISVSVELLADATVASQLQTVPWLTGDHVVTALVFPPGSPAYEQHLLLGLIPPGAEASLPVHPVQLYESVAVILALVALSRRPAGSCRPGGLALFSTGTYAVLRFFTEFLRADSEIVVSGLSLVQLQCLAILLGVGIILGGSRLLESRMIESRPPKIAGN